MALSVFNWAGGPEDPSYNFVYFGWSFVALENNPLCIDFRFSIGIGFFLSAFALILSALSDSSGSFMVDFWFLAILTNLFTGYRLIFSPV
jgi:hypothetical protein